MQIKGKKILIHQVTAPNKLNCLYVSFLHMLSIQANICLKVKTQETTSPNHPKQCGGGYTDINPLPYVG